MNGNNGKVIKIQKDTMMKANTRSTIATYPIKKVFSLVSNELTMSIENRFNCLQLLQESLNLKELLTNFASIVAKVIRPFNVRFQSAHGLFSLNNQEKYDFSNSYHLPLSSKSPRIGSITYQSNKPLAVSENKLLIELHQLLVPSLRHAVKLSELNILVFKDHLTKIGNRAYYDESMQRAIEQSSRSQQPLSLMLLDIDNFKPINDNLGHLKGDQVLQHFATILSKIVRGSDMVFRLGGDEFAIILQHGDQQSIDIINGRLTAEISKDLFLTDINFSASIGYAHWQLGDNVTTLFDIADKKLYFNKSRINKRR